MQLDSRGLNVTASNSTAVELLDSAISAYLGMRKDTAGKCASVVESDPYCVMGLCLSGYLSMHACSREGATKAEQFLRQALVAADEADASAPERLHVSALEAWYKGDLVAAVEAWERILVHFPLDVLALRLAQFLTSYLGQSKGIRDSVARVFPAWNESTRDYGFVLSCYAYGLEENGEFERAEYFGRRALEMNPQDLWGTHAVAHVMEMQGRVQEGVQWIRSAEKHWQDCGNFVNHLWWHCALLHLAAGKYDDALELYDQKVRAEGSDEYLDLANAAALLWRLEQADVSVGKRWGELAKRVVQHLDEQFFVFVDLHKLIAIAANSPWHAQDFLESCLRYASDLNCTEAQVMRDVGLPIAKAIIAHRNQAYGDAANLLLTVKDLVHRIGGSHAQRDLFDQMLIDSVLRAGRLSLARSLLDGRIEKRPSDLWARRTLASIS